MADGLPTAENVVEPAPPATRYRAFLSYSWRDKVWGRRLHRWLESYKIPIGVDARLGPDRRIGRIFRDDEDMAAAGDIGALVRRAIENSENLIVLCSPSSAQSVWVQSEIEHFRATNPQGQVFAVIVDGAPNAVDPAVECFPPALRVIRQDNAMPIEPLGVDVRRDGRARVCARLAAGMLGVDFDDLWRRDRRREERATQIRITALSALALVLAGLAAVAAASAHNAHVALGKFFAERAWQRLEVGDPLAATRYALAGMQVAPENERLYLAALSAIAHETAESLPPLLHDGAVTSAIYTPDGARL
ncbi:MAG: toll/interleukin-1 receptor domain-containing protein, partial [Parvularculaceae bacterium]|nr:toll/interleukin-1 receptor domain-containing protein [Parvularculaceae bacterium]